MHPQIPFKFSDGWFMAFKNQNQISYRSTTNISQHQLHDLEAVIQEFYQNFRNLAKK